MNKSENKIETIIKAIEIEKNKNKDKICIHCNKEVQFFSEFGWLCTDCLRRTFP
jgi:hypothetical protein